MRLVADIGGTNSRLAIADAGQLRPGSTRSFRNEDFASFDAVVDAYLTADDGPAPEEFVVAVAGPVDGDTARLTNRNWEISAPRLAARLGEGRGKIINDLVALGYSVPQLGPEDMLTVANGTPENASPRQSLVVGIGTGFNVSPVVEQGDTLMCLRAEFGHTALPASIAKAMDARQPGLSEAFPTVEHCFSGRGFSEVCRQVTGRTASAPEAFMRLCDEGDPAISGAVGFYAELMGWLHRELMLTYLPTTGVYFAGSVARSILTRAFCTRFRDITARAYPVATHATTPAFVITADTAALHGCAQVPLGRD